MGNVSPFRKPQGLLDWVGSFADLCLGFNHFADVRNMVKLKLNNPRESEMALFLIVLEVLFMNFGTKLRTVLAIATCLNTALMSTDLTGFDNVYVDFAYKIISIVLNFVIVALVTWFNNDFTEEACRATGLMRQCKEIERADYDGETYERGDDDE